ncbi:hypothetical protein CS345_00655 [Bordetella bronchiseptica]|uniref:Uncharacterized protein n=4 Tax=Bordetella TaxID=517 RepID=A0A0C6PA39_BORBO|nr:hypothetical protein B7P10_00655 [Bordetella bronchiseptica]CCJ55201.1 hypothetical protein BN112_3286 [Bordetella bronchiseptica 253]CCN20912.1 hypothetical protein BN113_0126 [Bordetella bronchiseptica 1289]AWP82677.1 hypothetical protein B7P00_00655 [Bordetella bronchiseptica]AWQ08245.1 hypothetical protein B9G72_00655 [Bordetella bronchiseptica]
MTGTREGAAMETDSALKYHYSDFTREAYRSLLRTARASYVFRSYDTFDPQERFVLWRHDLDFSVHAASALAEIEAQEQVSSTYFLLLHSDFYNLLERDVSRKVERILALGHRIGLHFDCGYYGISSVAQLEDMLAMEARLLERVFGQRIDVFSFHNPDAWMLQQREVRYAGLLNTYSEFFRDQVGYCSDSNGYWRHRRLADVLEQAADHSLQVLTHPGWWVDEPMSPRDRIARCAEGRAAATMRKYDEDLACFGRDNIGKST